jgi:hypothetical protein
MTLRHPVTALPAAHPEIAMMPDTGLRNGKLHRVMEDQNPLGG